MRDYTTPSEGHMPGDIFRKLHMKIAVTSTPSWPYVRRGNRCSYELAAYLVGRGHEVHYITTKPGTIGREKLHEKLHVEYKPLSGHPFLSKCKIHFVETFTLACLRSLLRNNFDIVMTTFPVDAFAARMNKFICDTPFIHLQYDAYPLYPVTALSNFMFRSVVKSASRVIAISDFVKKDLNKYFLVEADVIPLPVDTSRFRPVDHEKVGNPVILCTAALTVSRKRVNLLVKAFERLVEKRPEAVLILSGHSDAATNRVLLQSVNANTRKSIKITGVGQEKNLPDLYRQAALTVLPSVHEAFGLVVIESLASGIPVVGTRSGGIPDILNNHRIGVLFEPSDGPAKICDALLRGLELARDPQTRLRCRQHAECFSWDTLGPQYELCLQEVSENSSPKTRSVNFLKRKK
jgi:glycosyltransferase involved in cell wall biosynthesis